MSATTAQLADLLGVPTDQVRRRLHVPRRRGEWVSPAHGLWIPVPLEFRAWGAPQGSELVDTLMRHMGVDYYVGWLSAAELYGAAHQKPQVFQVATSRHVRSRQVGRTRFGFMTRSDLGQVPATRMNTRSGFVRVASREATMLDVVSNVHAAVGMDNAATVIIELAEDDFDSAALVEAARMFPAAAGRRVGWILEKFAECDDLEPLRAAVVDRVSSPWLLDPLGPTTGATDRRWRLRINRQVDPDV